MDHHTFPDRPIPKAYGPYSHAVEAGGFVFVAGQIGRDSHTGVLIEGDVAAQTQRAIEIVRDILGELGLGLKDVVRSTVYLADINDFTAMSEVYAREFPAPYSARSTPEVKLPFGAKVSLEVTAWREPD